MDMQCLPIQILLLADNEDDYRLVRDLLSNLCASGGTLRWASDYAVAIDTLLSGKFDVCLLDHRLGLRTGLEILEEVTRAGCPTPVIFLTDNGDYRLDLEAMRIGAADYLTKDQLSAPLLERSIRYAMERRRKKEAYNDLERQVKERTADLVRVNAELKREVEERKRAEEMLRLSEKELQRAEAVAHFGNWGFMMGRNEARISNGVKLICGLEESTLPIAYLRSLVLPEYRSILHDAIKGLTEENRPCNIELKIRRPIDGKIVDIHAIAEYSPEQRSVFGVIQDITERKRTEQALQESEERYRKIAECVPDLIWTMDLSGRFTYANSAVERAYGWTVEEFQKLTYQNPALIEEELLLATSPQYDRNTIRTFESRELRKDGSVFPGEVSAAFLWSEDGKPVGIVGATRDITERKRSEEALQAAHQQLKGIIEFLPDATFVVDQAGKVIAWNRAIEEITGVPKEKMIGKGFYAYAVPFYGEPRPILIDLVMKSIEGYIDLYDSIERQDNLLSGELFVPEAYGGKGAYLWGIASPLFDNNGNLIGAIEAIRDMTEQKRIESTLRKREADLEEKAHQLEEINTALKVLLRRREEDKKDMEESLLTNAKESMLPFLEKLKKTRLDGNQKTYLEIIESQLDDIISPFLKHLSSRFTNLTPMEIKVAKLIKEGRMSKEIAEILGVSEQTILTHRNNLRAKLGLRNEKANLRSHLMNLT